jgi:hypothetical protein
LQHGDGLIVTLYKAVAATKAYDNLSKIFESQAINISPIPDDNDPVFSNMSTERGDFYYPLEEDHLNINYNDQVDVYWWSTFAELLLINCSESVAGGKGYSESNYEPLLVIALD